MNSQQDQRSRVFLVRFWSERVGDHKGGADGCSRC